MTEKTKYWHGDVYKPLDENMKQTEVLPAVKTFELSRIYGVAAVFDAFSQDPTL